MLGMIASIQRCSIHDGPGIRTSIFLKGCNLRCAWCHNPETLSFEPQELFHPERCIHCGQCAQGCFSGARVLCGKQMSVEEAAEEALRDRDYYGLDGGVTLTGGEPTCQAEFSQALLEYLSAQGIHTAIESNLCCPEETLRQVIGACDLVMADLKIFDDGLHRRYTGAGNERILQNLRHMDKPLVLRTPVIRGINDAPEEIERIAAFAGALPTLLYYELLPYHPLGLSKGAGGQQRFEAPSKEQTEALARIAQRYCAQVRITGRKIA